MLEKHQLRLYHLIKVKKLRLILENYQMGLHRPKKFPADTDDKSNELNQRKIENFLAGGREISNDYAN